MKKIHFIRPKAFYFVLAIIFTILTAFTGSVLAADPEPFRTPDLSPIDSDPGLNINNRPANTSRTNTANTPGAPSYTNTAGTPTDTGGLRNPLKSESIGDLVRTAVQYFSYIVIIFAVLAFIWVGLQYILARGKPDRMKELSTWLGYIIIGVAVVLGAQLIITLVINTLQSAGVVDERVIQSSFDALER